MSTSSDVLWISVPALLAFLLCFGAWRLFQPLGDKHSATDRPPTFVETVVDKMPRFSSRRKQRWDAFLVLDVEGTCEVGTTFGHPNEIIEWPVVLLKWTDKQSDGRASKLEVVDEFRTFVKPTWRPQLSKFCTSLTGITQDQVDLAPAFAQVMDDCAAWLAKHNLIDEDTGKRTTRFCWCTDGPWDLRDFLIKQLFISNMELPAFLDGPVLNVRQAVDAACGISAGLNLKDLPKRQSLNLERQLRVLGLPAFQGRLHSGIDDARNIARIIQALAARGVELVPLLNINPRRRWPWMGKKGKVLEEYIQTNQFVSQHVVAPEPASSSMQTQFST